MNSKKLVLALLALVLALLLGVEGYDRYRRSVRLPGGWLTVPTHLSVIGNPEDGGAVYAYVPGEKTDGFNLQHSSLRLFVDESPSVSIKSSSNTCAASADLTEERKRSLDGLSCWVKRIKRPNREVLYLEVELGACRVTFVMMGVEPGLGQLVPLVTEAKQLCAA